MIATEDGALSLPAARADEEALAPATARAYGRDWAAFRAWCRKAGCSALPASPEDVASYLAALVADCSRTRGTLNRQLAAITCVHRAEDHAWGVGAGSWV